MHECVCRCVHECLQRTVGVLADRLVHFFNTYPFFQLSLLFLRLFSWQVDCLESTLEKSLQAKFPSSLRVSILLDFTRGSRGRSDALPGPQVLPCPEPLF